MTKEYERVQSFFEESGVWVSGIEQNTLSMHAHNFYEIVYVWEGFCLHHLEDEVFLASEGDIFVIRPGIAHRYTGTKGFKIYNCLFEEEILSLLEDSSVFKDCGLPKLLNGGQTDFMHIHLNMTERKQIQSMLDRMEKECREKTEGWIVKVRAMLYCVLTDYLRICRTYDIGQGSKDVYFGYVTKAIDYITEHYAEKHLTVQLLGEYAGVSGDYLSRQFRKVTGIAVKEYIRRFRLSRAIISLQQGCSVTEAAEKNGFYSLSYFSREFKKEMGVSPSQYYV